MKFILFLLSSLLVFGSPALAEIGWKQGIVRAKKLPEAGIAPDRVYLDVPHRSQGRDPLCVPTSTSMILAYFGEDHDKRTLKALAENHKPASQRNTEFTYFRDMQHGLRQIGRNWTIRTYKGTDAGFRDGLRDIRAALRQGYPVMIDVHMDAGHTFVVAGYDDARQVVFIRDPLLRASQARILSYQDLRENWHNHRFGPGRVAMFSK